MLRMGASFLTLFLAGWKSVDCHLLLQVVAMSADALSSFFASSGGSTGALIPYIEEAFAITYAHVAILFVCTFVGYLVAAAGAGTLARRAGFGYAMCISVIVELVGVCILECFI